MQTTHIPFKVGNETFVSVPAFIAALSYPVGNPHRKTTANDTTISKTPEAPGEQVFFGNASFSRNSKAFHELLRLAVISSTYARGGSPRLGTEELNVVSSGTHTNLISSFAATPFEIDGHRFGSAEAFIQLTKYRSDHPLYASSRHLHGVEAKRLGAEANRSRKIALSAGGKISIYWNSEEIPFRSDAYYALMLRALQAKFTQNIDAMTQLRATGNRTLVHKTRSGDSPITAIPAKIFCTMLTDIRAKNTPVSELEQLLKVKPLSLLTLPVVS